MAGMDLGNQVQNIRGSADTLLECAGLTFDEIRPIAEAMEHGGRKAAARAVTDAVLQKVCPIAGTPSQCIERLEEYRASGCTHIMLELWGDRHLHPCLHASVIGLRLPCGCTMAGPERKNRIHPLQKPDPPPFFSPALNAPPRVFVKNNIPADVFTGLLRRKMFSALLHHHGQF